MVGEGTRYWMPMDQYIGGIEHAILHLLYARFWTKVMRDLKLVTVGEPFMRLMTQGMVLKEAFVRTTEQGGREYFWESDLTIARDEHQKVVSVIANRDGLPVEYEGWTTMSKSKSNGVDPEVVIERYGADTARLFGMFAAPPDQTVEWTDSGVEGAHRFLRRVWHFCARHRDRVQTAPAVPATLTAPARTLRRELHGVLRQVSYDYDRMQYNTVVSGAMKMLNALEGFEPSGDDVDAAVVREGASILLRTLYPACPHMTHALWQGLGFDGALGDMLDAPWPAVDDAALVQDEIELVLQVNGKTRGSVRVSAQADKATIERAALASPEFAKFGEGKPARKVVIVPARLVNVVV
jgi:leucyl-tRNA synthetase